MTRGLRTAVILLGLLAIAAAPPPAAASQDEAAPPPAVDPEEALREADAAFAAGDHARARALYAQAVHAGAGGIEALRRLALLETWAGNLNRADAIYRDMEARHLEAIRAHLARADLRVRRGDLNGALAFYRDVLKAEPGNLEARLGVARVHHWLGLDRAAQEQADNIALDHPDSFAAGRLRDDIRAALRPEGAVDGFRSSDGDANRVEAVTAAATWRAEPQTSIRVAYTDTRAESRCRNTADCDDPGVTVGDLVTADARSLTAGLHWRVISDLLFHFETAVVQEDSFDGDSRTLAVGGGYLRWQVGPRFAATGSAWRQALMDSAVLIDRGLRVDFVEIRLDHRFMPRWLLGGAGGFGRYSDGNDRVTASASVAWEPDLPIGLTGTFEVLYRSFDEDLDNGYFDPSRYHAELLSVTVWDRYHDGRFFWRLEATCGRQNADVGAPAPAGPASDETVQTFRATAGTTFGGRSTLEAFYSDTDDALQTATGFESSRAGVVLRHRF